MTQNQIIAAICFAMAVHAYVIISLYWQNKLSGKYTKDQWGFWGKNSWWRKYKFMLYMDHKNEWAAMGEGLPMNIGKDIISRMRRWYHKTFEVKYKEKFPFSATALVFLTDGMHLTQFIMIKLFCAAVAFAVSETWWVILLTFVGVRLLWLAVFNLWYKILG